MPKMSNNDEIILWLRHNRVETGSLMCFACGHEHNCSTHGCAMMSAAASAMENLRAENDALRRMIELLRMKEAADGRR